MEPHLLHNDANDNTIKALKISNQSGCVSFNASVFEELKNKKHPIFIYTTSLPKDPAIAATVRVRRMMICKIEWI